MHVHLPKPLHGWRAFSGEVGIIVVGVLVALAAEQAVEDWRWHEKVAAATKSIDFELNTQLDYSEEVMGFARCTPLFVDALEAGLLALTMDDARRTRTVIDMAATWRNFDAALAGAAG